MPETVTDSVEPPLGLSPASLLCDLRSVGGSAFPRFSLVSVRWARIPLPLSRGCLSSVPPARTPGGTGHTPSRPDRPGCRHSTVGPELTNDRNIVLAALEAGGLVGPQYTQLSFSAVPSKDGRGERALWVPLTRALTPFVGAPPP